MGIGIPIYNGSVYKRQQRVAEINTENADIQRKSLERDYKASVIKNFQAYTTSLKQLEAERNTYDTAQQLLRYCITTLPIAGKHCFRSTASARKFYKRSLPLSELKLCR